MTTLIERLSECTHTFHFQFEIKITPLDFATIIGFPFTGQQIPFDVPEDLAGLCRDLLGCSSKFSIDRGDIISYNWLWRG